MDFDTLKNKFEDRFAQFLEIESYLLDNNLSERCITHKLAEHLQQEFTEFNVDCEYDKNVADAEGKKCIVNLKYKLEELKKKYTDTDEDNPLVAKAVYPDIVIHKRGVPEKNQLVIEVKKSINDDDDGKNYDLLKVQAYTYSENGNNLKYKFGLFLDIRTGKMNVKNKLAWYQNGEEINSYEI